MSKFLIGSAALAALIVIAPATAQLAQAPMHYGQGAKVHTRAQLAAQVQIMFQRLDANRDGFISRDESQTVKGNRGNRQAHREQRANRTPEQRTEKRAEKRANAFARIDGNRDGVISRDEFVRAPATRQSRVAGADGSDRRLRWAGAGPLRSGGGMGMAGLRGRMFDTADINRDSRVSLQEATAAAYRHFDMADANRDGQVTRDERKAMHQRLRTGRNNG